ncbi:MAG: [FeFe] hydrogenase H-cluster maturation GTPase HydF [Clostridiales Family XIII bacterium]|jgi:[FeFe] hydrogenase H-cluster maturation GTPase HydF|nr:[FeFe] hydrogenase H-cluster maturation GTPase HydF [Clostridiales Family XIII bacterium]
MSLQSTPVANRTHIAIFGRRNAGKSGLINAITGQSLAIVSEVAGTTTDPVSKTMELLPLGPVVIIDTAGIDDSGELGEMRVNKSYQILNKTDIAVIVIDATDFDEYTDEYTKDIPESKSNSKIEQIPESISNSKIEQKNPESISNSKIEQNPESKAESKAKSEARSELELGSDISLKSESKNNKNVQSDFTTPSRDIIKNNIELINKIKAKNIPYVVVLSKIDLLLEHENTLQLDNIINLLSSHGITEIMPVSSTTKVGIHELKEKIASLKPDEQEKRLVGDLVIPNDFVVLVTPIDSAAPKGRLILPQQQVVRDLLEAGAVSIVIRETELEDTLSRLTGAAKPKLVITDSQAFALVSKITPEDMLLTSFSILFARYKGELDVLVNGANAIDALKDGDTVLISEGCTHHRQCDDIGTVKMPRWLSEYTGKKLNYAFTSGVEFPTDLSEYKLVVHCGGCTLNEREMKHRISHTEESGIAITNYGTAIAHMNGILARSLEVFS